MLSKRDLTIKADFTGKGSLKPPSYMMAIMTSPQPVVTISRFSVTFKSKAFQPHAKTDRLLSNLSD